MSRLESSVVEGPARRARTPERAIALWKALKRAKKDGLSAGEAENKGHASAVYARKTMRAWAKAGLVRYEPPADAGREASGRYFLKPGAPALPPIVHADETISDRGAVMTPQDFAAIRRQVGLSLSAMATALGWTGLQPTRTRAMRRFENGERPIDKAFADRVRALISSNAG